MGIKLEIKFNWRTYESSNLRTPPYLTLVLYGINAPIIGPFFAWKPPIPYAIKNQRGYKYTNR